MLSQGHCRPSIKKKKGGEKKWKGEEEIAEHPVLLPSCLHSAAEAVNSKELKHIGHHLQHPSFQKLPLFTLSLSLPLPADPFALSLWWWHSGRGGGAHKHQPDNISKVGARIGRLSPQRYKRGIIFCLPRPFSTRHGSGCWVLRNDMKGGCYSNWKHWIYMWQNHFALCSQAITFKTFSQSYLANHGQLYWVKNFE